MLHTEQCSRLHTVQCSRLHTEELVVELLWCGITFVFPVHAWTLSEVSKNLSFSDFLNFVHRGSKNVIPSHIRLYFQGDIPSTPLCYCLHQPIARSLTQKFRRNILLLTPPGFELFKFRLEIECLTQMRHSVTHLICIYRAFKILIEW
jgi:hypothetical protein